MENWLIASLPILFKVIFSVVLVFVFLIFFTRLSGLRTFAKMSSVDFATTIAVGSILGTIIIDPSHSVLKGAVAVGGLFLLQFIITFLSRQFRWVEKAVTNTPILLMDGETILYDNLAKSNLSVDVLFEKLREANVLQLSDVKAVVFETTGDVVVLHGDPDKELDEILLRDVRRS